MLKNPTFFFLNLAGASEGLLVTGFAAFLPKLIENQFSLTPIWSAMLMGIIVVPAGGGGSFLGGYIIKKLDLTCSGIIKLCLFATMGGTVFLTCFFLTCPNLAFAGVTAPYGHHQSKMMMMDGMVASSEARLSSESTFRSAMSVVELDSECNSKCDCGRRNYDPICGVDGVMYYSPCHAGCGKELTMDNAKVYLDCECISIDNGTAMDREFDAINTMCDTKCKNLWYFVALCFAVMLLTFVATMPSLAATLRLVEVHTTVCFNILVYDFDIFIFRCVHTDQRSLALGIQWIKIRLLGTIPAPMIFGVLIDDTCILWQESCENAGACLVYDNTYMSK